MRGGRCANDDGRSTQNLCELHESPPEPHATRSLSNTTYSSGTMGWGRKSQKFSVDPEGNPQGPPGPFCGENRQFTDISPACGQPAANRIFVMAVTAPARGAPNLTVGGL